MSNLQIFKNEKLNLRVRTIQNEDGSISINVEDTILGFGITKIDKKNGKEYIRLDLPRFQKYIEDVGFGKMFPNVKKDDCIPETLFYLIGMKASNKTAQDFQRWLAIDVIPQIRQTGSYENQPKKLSAMEQLKLQYEVLEEHEARFTKIEGQLERLEVNPSQRKAIQNARHKRVGELLGGKKTLAYKDSSFRSKVYSEMGRAFNNYFDVPSYDCTPKNRFAESLEVIESYNLSTELAMELKKINNQISFDHEAIEEVACTK